MGCSRAIHKECRRHRLGAIASGLLLFIIFLLTVFLLQPQEAATSSVEQQKSQLNLELRVDVKKRARAYCNGVQTVVSIADYFEFFERTLIGGRKRIAQGPWGGLLQEISAGVYTLAGSDPISGATYTITFKQVDSSSLELSLAFKAPTQPSNLGFDILKLSSDLFLGAALEAAPSSFTDAKGVPVEPLPQAKRMLLTNKNRVLMRGSFCVIEITDLADSRTIYVADSRNVSWDKRKSILFGVSKEGLSPGKEYSFRYSIRCLSPC